MRILVTGGSGFIGGYLINELVKQGHNVTNVDIQRPTHNHQCWTCLNIEENLKGLFNVFRNGNFDVVYHLAAQTSVPHSVHNPIQDAHTNIVGTLNILDMCKSFDIKKLIFASTAASYGIPEYTPIDEGHPLDPQSPYGISKVACESYIRTSGVPYTILRFANVYGYGGEGVISQFISQTMSNATLTIFGDGKQTRDFIYVKDLVSALIKCIDKADRKTLNLSTNTVTSLNEIVELMKEKFPFVNVQYRDKRIGDVQDSLMSNVRAMLELEWEPKYTLSVGLTDMLFNMRTRMIES